jgi:hypothetical protein
MSQNFEKIFSLLEPISPSAELKGAILSQVIKEKRKRLVLKLGLDGLAFLLSTSLTTFATLGIWTSLNSTALRELMALLWSDLPVVMTYWQDFAYAILDALPVGTIFIMTLALFWTLWFGRDFVYKRHELTKI